MGELMMRYLLSTDLIPDSIQWVYCDCFRSNQCLRKRYYQWKSCLRPNDMLIRRVVELRLKDHRDCWKYAAQLMDGPAQACFEI